VFLSALLLFQVQLVLAKYILPFFGGAPSVWNTCMLFFQTLLLLGYGYAHVLSLQKNPRFQGRVHSFLLIASVALLVAHWMKWGSPIAPGGGWKLQQGSDPILRILELLCVAIGLPFFLLSSTGPLLQKWFSGISNRTTPYWLYALSNAGSLLGLLSYPFFFEWTLTVKHQTQFWFAGYVLFVLLCLMIARGLRTDAPGSENLEEPNSAVGSHSERPGPSQYFLWTALSACSSTMLLAATNLLCQDIAVIPLLWVWPLSIYLFSFIVVFGSTLQYRRGIFWPLYFVSLVVALKVSFLNDIPSIPMQLVAYSLALFAVCMVCHGELARSKPGPQHLTSFYCMVASGGALGGLFVVLIAPQVFRGFWEFQAALLGCGFLLTAACLIEDPTSKSEEHLWGIAMATLIAFLVPQLQGLFPRLASVRLISKEYYTGALALAFLLVRGRWHVRESCAVTPSKSSGSSWRPVVVLGLLGLLAIVSYSHTLFGSQYTIFQERNFFGVKYVTEDLGEINLINGGIIHGAESSNPRERDIPTLYFRRTSGIGLLLSNYPRGSSGRESIRAGVIGLGAGTLAAYGRSGDYLRFYEIDPTVIRISIGSHPFFHFVEDTQASVQVVVGDARLSLEREARQGMLQRFDVLAVDAFSGDAIPVHLLTREAMEVYLRHLRGPDSVVAFHISNRYLDLAPVVVGLAEFYQLHSTLLWDGTSRWILLARNPAILQLPNLAEKSRPVRLAKHPLLWTDDYSNLFQVLRHTSLQAALK
jgi:hypothetical protein